MYKEDVLELDGLLSDATVRSALNQHFQWYFLCELYGQHQLLREGEDLGPGAFGLQEAFNLSTCLKFSAHIAINDASADPAFSLFWHEANIDGWSGRRGKFTASVSQKAIGTDGVNTR